jgi:hypothetical protein
MRDKNHRMCFRPTSSSASDRPRRRSTRVSPRAIGTSNAPTDVHGAFASATDLRALLREKGIDTLVLAVHSVLTRKLFRQQAGVIIAKDLRALTPAS